ncbi:hypothetical protein tb265_10310 [Gemmatimonadetes bacterium T265]|nr:hypothetical protein tb265_10310 [Gemmatimonadetes bacterium T265]
MSGARASQPRAGRARFALPQLALVGGTVALALALGAWQERRRGGAGDADADARALTLTAGPGAGVVALPVRAADGRAVALTRLGAPAVVMVVSTTCGVCKEALADFGRTAAGRALPRLYLLTLEGAGEGPALALRAGVRGAEYVGPESPAAEAYFTTAIAGTPTFVALDAAGHATRVLPGYPGLDAMRGWVRVMDGTRGVVQ